MTGHDTAENQPPRSASAQPDIDPEPPAEDGAAERTDSPSTDTQPTGARAAKARRAVLEAERDFLLASLADLEAEHATGDLDDQQYETLTDRYTARAARVLRTLDRTPEITNTPSTPRRRATWRRRAVVLVPLVAVLATSVAFLPSALSRRQAGQTITGNAQSADDTRARIEQAVTDDPDDPAAHRTYARLLLADDDLVDALRHYDDAARLDPTDAESRAYAGWIALAGLTDDALERLDAAVDADPTYADSHLFRGMVRRDQGDTVGATADFQRFLELAPDTPLRPQVEQLLAGLEATPQPGA